MNFATESASAMNSQVNILPHTTIDKDKLAANSAATLRKKTILLISGATVLGTAILLGTILGILASQNIIGSHAKSVSSSSNDSSTASAASPTSTSSTVDNPSAKSACEQITNIPADIKGTYLDMTTWGSSIDFNCTYTNETVGGLPLMGLNYTWDNSARANPQVPPLNTTWGSYTARPARGVNIGGWLSLEPFITPSLFNYSATTGVIDEYTLMRHLGANASAILENHYATFITEADFAAIAAAGLDHVRIAFSYWAVTTYDGDPYLRGVSWRYLLRGLEWARHYGLRVNLDLHGLPGSQNGWNHSGRAGNITWILGANATGAVNRQRSLDIHSQLAAFFAQDRYHNLVTLYGLANEPGASVPTDDLQSWTVDAYNVVRNAGFNGTQVFSDGIRGVTAWDGLFDGYGDSLAIDTHLYAVFSEPLLNLTRREKISYACTTWKNASVGYISSFGPTLIGEFSAADNDCTRHLNGFDVGNRWDGSFASNDGQPWCPVEDSRCSCSIANEDMAGWPDKYVAFLQAFTYAQMEAFEETWGWFYWTWKTESAPLLSYKHGMERGFLPEKAYERDWKCSDEYPDLTDLPEYE